MPQEWTPRRLAALYTNGFLRKDVLAMRHIIPAHQQYRAKGTTTPRLTAQSEQGLNSFRAPTTERSLPSTARSTSRTSRRVAALPTGLLTRRTYNSQLLERRTNASNRTAALSAGKR